MITPAKILLIGTMGSGKTTIAERLARDTGFPYVSIDACRMKSGDGTMAGEDRAWDHFLTACSNPAPAVLEFSGIGPHADEVREALRCSGIPVTVIWLVIPIETCIARRALQQKPDAPAPYPWGPVERAIPVFHTAIELAWECSWSREPSFHAVRQEFSGTVSPDQVYAAVRKVC